MSSDTQARIDSAPQPAALPSTIPEGDSSFWHSLIDERTAGHFLGLVERTMQAHRQRGNGPRFIALSKRCVRYRRADLKSWADAHIRTSTSDTGPAEAA